MKAERDDRDIVKLFICVFMLVGISEGYVPTSVCLLADRKTNHLAK